MKKVVLVLMALILSGCASLLAPKPVAFTEFGNGYRVELFTEKGKCEPPTLTAKLIKPSKEVVMGCWSSDGDLVAIKWDDGMMGLGPADRFIKVQ